MNNCRGYWSFDNPDALCHDDSGNGNDFEKGAFCVSSAVVPPTVYTNRHPYSMMFNTWNYASIATTGLASRLNAGDFTATAFFRNPGPYWSASTPVLCRNEQGDFTVTSQFLTPFSPPYGR